MEKREKSQDGSKLAYISFVAAFLLFVACLGALIYQKQHSRLFGKEILFTSEYVTAQGIQQVGPGRLMFSECVKEPTSVKITEDTVIFKTKKGSIGFKPLSVKDLTKIPCIRQDGTRVNIERIKTPPKSEYTTDEIIILVQPELTIVLTKEIKCVPLGQN